MGCETTVLSESELGCVTVCDCGTVTIHCGNAAMRVHKEAFTVFSRMLDEAFAGLAARELNEHPQRDVQGNRSGKKNHPDSGSFFC